MTDCPAAYVRVDKFHPPKTFRFPRREFGSKGETRSLKAECCEKFDWLHYDASADATFCHVCMSAELEKKFLASTKRDHAFISKGFTNWKFRRLRSKSMWPALVIARQCPEYKIHRNTYMTLDSCSTLSTARKRYSIEICFGEYCRMFASLLVKV